jgi:hypothetical protein
MNSGKLSEDQLQELRERDPNWAYNMCCGKCFGGTCWVDMATGEVRG